MANGGIYGGLNAGLQAGLQTGIQLYGLKADGERQKKQEARQDRLDSENRQDRQFSQGLQLRQDARADSADARQLDLDQISKLKMHVSDIDEQANANNQLIRSLVQQGVGNDDPRAQQALQRANELHSAKRDLTASMYGPAVNAASQDAHHMFSQLKDTDDLDSIDDQRFARNWAVQFRRPPTDFLDGDDGTPSAVGAGYGRFDQAMQAGDTDGAFQAFGELAQHEFNLSAGQMLPDGSVIQSVKPSMMMPHPGDQAHAMIGLDVTAKRPDGTVYTYPSQLTENRSSHPDDPVRAFPIQKGLDYVGGLGAAHSLANNPAVREKLQRGWTPEAQQEYGDISSAYLATGGDYEKLQPKFKWESGPGGSGMFQVDEHGNQTGKKIAYVPLPPAAERPGEADLRQSQAELNRQYVENMRGGLGKDGRPSSANKLALYQGSDGKQYKFDPVAGEISGMDGSPLPTGIQVFKVGTDQSAKASQAKPIPGEIMGRLALGETYARQAPDLLAAIEQGKVSGVGGTVGAALNVGDAGLIVSRQDSGVDALVRNLTGAGKPPSEALEYAGRYKIQPTDSKKRASEKVRQLTYELANTDRSQRANYGHEQSDAYAWVAKPRNLADASSNPAAPTTQPLKTGGGFGDAPVAGHVDNGFRFKGGDPANQANWEKVQ
jgi:hypothetical protein